MFTASQSFLLTLNRERSERTQKSRAQSAKGWGRGEKKIFLASYPHPLDPRFVTHDKGRVKRSNDRRQNARKQF